MNLNSISILTTARKRRNETFYGLGEKVHDFFWQDNHSITNFEHRPGQQDMAYEILEAMKERQHIVIEAGVGIGKSYAYLVPLMLYNADNQKPVIIATSTIALQEQLLGDVKRLQPLLGISSRKQDVILAKGQTHYLCYKRFNEYASDPKADLLKKLRKSILSGSAERRDFRFPIPDKTWNKINISQYGQLACDGCTQECRYKRIRASLRSTHGIVICNQDFLTAHLNALQHDKGLINDLAEYVVIDEAHNLEEKVRNSTTLRINQASILSTIDAAFKSVPSPNRIFVQDDAAVVRESVLSFFKCLRKDVEQQIMLSMQDMNYADRFFYNGNEVSEQHLYKMIKRISNFSTSVEIYSSFSNRRDSDESGSDALDRLASNLNEIKEDAENKLFWIERKGLSFDLVYCPKNTRTIIQRLFFSGRIRTIMTSATLTTEGVMSLEAKYAYFIQNTGFPQKDGILSEPKQSPFPYDTNAMIYYCDDLPHPTKEHDAFIQMGIERLIEVLDISKGKALVLFTAKTDMEKVYAALTERELPYHILMQGVGSSQEAILKEFREDTDSVLLGSGAYWEGIDIQGKSLSNLVVFRLPFPVPDPIIEYKASIAKDSLMDVRVPEMIIKLKQGIGRLIRSKSDTGIVSIIDPRLRDSPATKYRAITWASLPIHNRTNSLEVLRRFYDQLPQNPDQHSTLDNRRNLKCNSVKS